VEGWKEWQCGYVSVPSGIPFQVRYHHRFGIDCFELLCPVGETSNLCKLLTGAGAYPVGIGALEIVRVEAGLPVYGIDIDENVLAPEVGRPAISYTKGCYLGQETIVRIRDLGHVNRMLRGLKLMGQIEPPRGSKVFNESKEVGEVTSSVNSSRLGRGIALAYLHRSCQEPGTRVVVVVGTNRVNAEVSALPFGYAGNV
jgi:folate-binding protein YgfZ